MKKLIFTFLVVTLLFGCGPALSDVKVGMTTSEVTELLGSPNHKSESSNSHIIDGVEESHSTASWEYNDLGKIEFEDDIVVSVE